MQLKPFSEDGAVSTCCPARAPPAAAKEAGEGSRAGMSMGTAGDRTALRHQPPAAALQPWHGQWQQGACPWTGSARQAWAALLLGAHTPPSSGETLGPPFTQGEQPELQVTPSSSSWPGEPGQEPARPWGALLILCCSWCAPGCSC